MQQILVTGGNGLLGYETLKLLSKSNKYHIMAIQRDIEKAQPLEHVKYIEVDLAQSNFAAHLPTSIDAVFHLAQSNNFRKFPEMAQDIFAVNTQVTFNLLDYAYKAGAKKFIFTSTGGIYTGSQPIFIEADGNSFDANAGFYATSKFISEKLVENYSKLMTTIIFRPFFIYGKRQKHDMLIPRLISNIKNNNEIALDGINGIHINPIHVEDAAMALTKSLELNQSSIFNLGGPERLSLRDLCLIIGNALNKSVQFATNESKVPRDVVGDITQLKSLLYTPSIYFKDRINELIKDEE